MKQPISPNFWVCVLAVSGIVLSGLFSGCKNDGKTDPVVYVEGMVTFGGSPLEGAKISFTPIAQDAAKAAWGTTDATGKYRLTSMNGRTDKGAIPGNYAVTVIKVESKKPVEPIRFVDSTDTEQFFYEHNVSMIPSFYGEPLRTPFRPISVANQKTNTIDLALESDGTEGIMIFNGQRIDYTD